MNAEQGSPPSVVRGIRRAAIIGIIVSLVVAAGLGIFALLSGEFGDVQARVLGTTLTFAAFGTTALCHLATVSRRVRAVGFAGIAASVIAATCALVLIWADSLGETWEAILKGLVLAAIAAVSLAQANLLLLLTGRPHRLIRVTLGVTLAAIAVVAVMIAVPLLTDNDIPGDDAGEVYWRIFGVIAILDALGTIALPILGLVLRTPVAGADAGVAGAAAAEQGSRAVTLPAGLATQLAERAAREGRTPDSLATELLQTALGAPDAAPGDPPA